MVENVDTSLGRPIEQIGYPVQPPFLPIVFIFHPGMLKRPLTPDANICFNILKI